MSPIGLNGPTQAAGCGKQGKGLEPFDCHAALGNFCRAWSPAKKVWCCNNKQKGCQCLVVFALNTLSLRGFKHL
jgi:hypothetical protein